MPFEGAAGRPLGTVPPAGWLNLTEVVLTSKQRKREQVEKRAWEYNVKGPLRGVLLQRNKEEPGGGTGTMSQGLTAVFKRD